MAIPQESTQLCDEEDITDEAEGIISCTVQHLVHYQLGTCESAICVPIESQIKSGVKIRIQIESLNRIFSTPTNINY